MNVNCYCRIGIIPILHGYDAENAYIAASNLRFTHLDPYYQKSFLMLGIRHSTGFNAAQNDHENLL